MYEVRLKKTEQMIVLMTRPYKSALSRLAHRSGTDMSHFVRQAIAEYILNHHEGEFNRIYDECLHDSTISGEKEIA